MPSPNEAHYIQLLLQWLELSAARQFCISVRFAASHTDSLASP